MIIVNNKSKIGHIQASGTENHTTSLFTKCGIEIDKKSNKKWNNYLVGNSGQFKDKGITGCKLCLGGVFEPITGRHQELQTINGSPVRKMVQADFAEAEKRLLADIIGKSERTIKIETDQYPSSVEIEQKSSVGKVGWAVKVYCSVGKEDEARDKALRIFREIERKLNVRVTIREIDKE